MHVNFFINHYLRSWTRWATLLFFVSWIFGCFLLPGCNREKGYQWVFSCSPDNDLYKIFIQSGKQTRQFEDPVMAINKARPGAVVMLLSEIGSEASVSFPIEMIDLVRKKRLSVYIEKPDTLPGISMTGIKLLNKERLVINSNKLAPGLDSLQILSLCGKSAHLYGTVREPLIVAAKVAGFDKAVYGLTGSDPVPVFFKLKNDLIFVATTNLSQFLTTRSAPFSSWKTLWLGILHLLKPEWQFSDLAISPTVSPAYNKEQQLPNDAELRTIRKCSSWVIKSPLLIHPEWLVWYTDFASQWHDRVGPMVSADAPHGNGNDGILEGFSSTIDQNGNQSVRWWRRADCQGEMAGALAICAKLLQNNQLTETAGNLKRFLLDSSIMTNGKRKDPKDPAFGLIGWNDVSHYSGNQNGYGVYYADDNARTILGILLADAALGDQGSDQRALLAIMANYRLSGKNGFIPNRIDEADLETSGWRYYHKATLISLSPHFQAYILACYLWAYHQTGFQGFYDKAEKAIRTLMTNYPNEWVWTNGLQQERARMLLPLAWLVRLSPTPEHQSWLTTMTKDLLAYQDESGAIREVLGEQGKGKYGPPASNEAYGTSEAPLIQTNHNRVADLLYTNNFAFLGLHEAATATGDTTLVDAEKRLAGFLCRIQVESNTHPELSGAWFRAFDLENWEYWASNADAGWGAWSIETGWTQSWIMAVMAMRQQNMSLWELIRNPEIQDDFNTLKAQMPLPQ